MNSYTKLKNNVLFIEMIIFVKIRYKAHMNIR